MRLQDANQLVGHGYVAIAALRLRRTDGRLAGRIGNRPSNVQKSSIEVYVLPTQPQQFFPAHSCIQHDGQKKLDMGIVAILDFSNQRLNGFTGKGFNSLAVLSSEVDTSAVGGVPVDQIVLVCGCQNFSQEGDLLVNGVCGIGLNGVHVVLYSADGDALDGFVPEEFALLPEPSALGYVGVSS